jgi:hypothetical protein
MKYLDRSFSVASGFGDGAPKEERFGRWIWDESQQKLVRYSDYRPPERAVSAPIITDRHYEGARATDGTDIGSRRKHQEYMKLNGLAPANDFSPSYYDRVRKEKAAEEKRERREAVIETYKESRR